MKLVLLLFFFSLSTEVWAQSIEPDSMLSRLKTAGAEPFIASYSKSIAPITTSTKTPDDDQLIQVAILAVAYKANMDTLQWNTHVHWLTAKAKKLPQQQAVLRFLFNNGGDFISERAVYVSMQDLGVKLAETWNQPRVQFSFLENKLGLELFSKSADAQSRLINQMRRLSDGQPYLQIRTAYHQGEHYRTLHNDSCTYYLQKYISGIQPFLGKENPYFLQETAWIQKADSGMLASAYRGYAMHLITKGEIKKAGEMLVLADQTIPDTSVYDVRKIENQISLSSLYADLVNKEKSLEYALQAVARCDKHQYIKLRNGRVASAYARALMINEKFPEAIAEYERSYTYFRNGLNAQDPKRQALCLSIFYAYLYRPDSALLWLHRAETIAVEPNDEVQFLTASARGLSGMLHSNRAGALTQLNEAYKIAGKNKNVRWMRESLYHYYLYYKASGQPAESLQAHETFVQLNDSLYRSGQQLALFDVEAGYQKSLQDETIARLDTENEAAAANLKAQKRNLMILIAGLLVAFVLLALVWRLYKQVKASNAIISKAIEEKNILLREIHHRVKNNLQVISSLLKLQSGYIKDDAAIQAIAEGRSRVQSMALLHQNLYKEDNLTGVNMKEYFDSLIQGLFDTYNISSDRISLHKNISEINLDVDTVVPLGLITNELISNALKHAFPGITSGNLFVDLYEDAGNLILKVRDDGTGLTSVASHDGFGSKLIQSLSQKLEADITTMSRNGTEVMLTIREYRKAA